MCLVCPFSCPVRTRRSWCWERRHCGHACLESGEPTCFYGQRRRLSVTIFDPSIRVQRYSSIRIQFFVSSRRLNPPRSVDQRAPLRLLLERDHSVIVVCHRLRTESKPGQHSEPVYPERLVGRADFTCPQVRVHRTVPRVVDMSLGRVYVLLCPLPSSRA